MSSNSRPVIIRRKKNIIEGGHHGGAWKVAYADFVTAMMAFFLMMWLLNATTEDQREGLADYFSPEIPVSRESGGGREALSGLTVVNADSLTGQSAGEDALEAELLETVADQLDARSGESEIDDDLLRHIRVRTTDEGLVVDLFDLRGAPLFDDEDRPTDLARDLVRVVDDAFAVATNEVAVRGHVRSAPVVLRRKREWSASTRRAEAVRYQLEGGATGAERLGRLEARADRDPLHPDPRDLRNNRIEIVLLRTR